MSELPDERPDPSAAPGRDPEAVERERKRAYEDDLSRFDADIREVEDFQMPLLEHLKELKTRLVWVGVALFLGTAVGFVYAREVFDFLQAPLITAMSQADGIEGGLSIVNSPFEGMITYLKVGVFTGFFLSSPIIAYQFWKFVSPGLYRSEKQLVVPLTFVSVALFMMGAAFCYEVMFPYAFPFFINVLGVNVNLSTAGYLEGVLQMIGAFGLCFEMPVFIFFLARAGLVDYIDLLKGFRYAVLAIFLVSAILTPPDVVTQTMLAIPMCLLYAVGIVVAKLSSTKVRDA